MTEASRSYQFRREREESWLRLEALITKAEKQGIRALSAEEVHELPQLYRGTLSGLSVARAISLDLNVVNYLEGLCSRAYFVLYGTREASLATIRDFIARRLPQAVRSAWLELWVAGGVFMLGIIVGLLLTLSNPDWYYTFVGADMAQGRTPMASTEELKAVIDVGTEEDESSSGYYDVFATYLFTHNAQVGLLAFALGFAFGLPTLYLLFVNGTTLGAFIALYASRGLTVELLGWLSIHGTTEIFAILLCGAAGLIVGRHLAFPGQLSRMENLSKNGRNAALIVVGAILMFLVAGLLEGFGRQMITDTTTRFTVAFVMLALWVGYYYFSGHEETPNGDTTAQQE